MLVLPRRAKGHGRNAKAENAVTSGDGQKDRIERFPAQKGSKVTKDQVEQLLRRTTQKGIKVKKDQIDGVLITKKP